MTDDLREWVDRLCSESPTFEQRSRHIVALIRAERAAVWEEAAQMAGQVWSWSNDTSLANRLRARAEEERRG